MQSALQDEIDALRRHFRSERDPAGLVFASLADAYRRAGELDEAWSLLEEGLEEHPDFTTGHLVAARVHRDRGQLEDASDRYNRVLELDPENTAALREKASLAEDEGRIEEALSLCQRLALLEPTDPDLRARIRELKEIHFRTVTEPGEEEEVEAVTDEKAEEVEVEPVDETDIEDAWSDDAWYEGLPIPESAAVPESEESDQSGFDPPTPGGGSAAEAGDFDERPGAEEEEADEEEDEGSEPAIYTRTMADLYARQGHVERALDVYEHLLERNPDDPDLRDRIRELNERADAPPEDGPTIGSYFESLLAWEGGE